MKISKLLTLIGLFFLSQNSFAQDVNEVKIIPQPNSIKYLGTEYVIGSKQAIVYKGFKQKPETLDRFTKEIIAQIPTKETKHSQSIVLEKTKTDNIHEAYSLKIDNTGIKISSSTEQGVFYGLQSLLQIILASDNNILAALEIKDIPRYKYRGLHLDVGRHLFPVSFIKSYIDLMAHYKLNNFHWHLTEDQGWRIEIKKYPKLTSIGGTREGTLINHLKDKQHVYDKIPYGGYYTQDEVKEVVAYAASKYINVIPEIELPGHSLAALSAYPEYGCGENPGPYKATMGWGIFDDVYCAGKESTFTFLQDILDEVLLLFPSKYIHIGGDECPKTKWKTCKYCQNRIKENKLKDEHELQSYFVQRIEKYLNGKGRSIIGWDEILEGGLAPNATVMSWRGVKGGIAAAKQHHDVIMTPSTHLYFDNRESISSEEPQTISSAYPTRHVSLKQVYSFNPSLDTLAPEFQKHVIGVQANLWTEYIKTPEKVLYHIMPRIYALAEIGWTTLENKNWENFSQIRVSEHLYRFDKTGKTYRVPQTIGVEQDTLLGETIEIKLKPSVKNAKIYYSINGYTPTEMDYLYTNPVKIHIPKGEERIFKSVVITTSGRRSVTSKINLINK